MSACCSLGQPRRAPCFSCVETRFCGTARDRLDAGSAGVAVEALGGCRGLLALSSLLQRRRVRPERLGPPTPVPARRARGALALPERRGRASWHTRTAPRTTARAVRGAPSCAADSPAGEHRTCAPHCLQCAVSVLTRLKEGQVQSAVTAGPWRAGPWASRAEERAASLEEVASSPHLRWQHSR